MNLKLLKPTNSLTLFSRSLLFATTLFVASATLSESPQSEEASDAALAETLQAVNGRFENTHVQLLHWPKELHADLGHLKKVAFMAMPREETTGKLPLLITLHGGGGKNWSIEEQLERSARVKGLGLAEKANRDLILLEPNSTESWDPKTLNTMLDYVLKTYPQIDDKRIYLLGHSMGGTGIWNWMVESPERFAATAPGGFTGGNEIKSFDAVLQVPVWAMVGGNDGERPAHIHGLVTMLREAGHENVGYTAFPGANHSQGNAAMFSAVHVVDWMLTHSKAN